MKMAAWLFRFASHDLPYPKGFLNATRPRRSFPFPGPPSTPGPFVGKNFRLKRNSQAVSRCDVENASIAAQTTKPDALCICGQVNHIGGPGNEYAPSWGRLAPPTERSRQLIVPTRASHEIIRVSLQHHRHTQTDPRPREGLLPSHPEPAAGPP